MGSGSKLLGRAGRGCNALGLGVRSAVPVLWGLAWIAMLSCSCAALTSRPASPTPVATVVGGKAFAIYLTAENIPPERLAMLSHLELADEPLLTLDEIVAYNQARHEIELTDAGYERVFALSVPTRGTSFVVCAHGRPVYAGAFWAAYSSQSFDGVVIDPLLATAERPVIRIQLGYPSVAFFQGEDPRADARVLAVLQQAGKLR